MISSSHSASCISLYLHIGLTTLFLVILSCYLPPTAMSAADNPRLNVPLQSNTTHTDLSQRSYGPTRLPSNTSGGCRAALSTHMFYCKAHFGVTSYILPRQVRELRSCTGTPRPQHVHPHLASADSAFVFTRLEREDPCSSGAVRFRASPSSLFFGAGLHSTASRGPRRTGRRALAVLALH